MNNPSGSSPSQTKVWYHAKDGQSQGPYTVEELKELAASGIIQADSLVWKEGLQNWIPAAEIKGLFTSQAANIPAATVRAPAAKNSNAHAPGAGDALIVCYGCGRQIKATAASCPNCGAPKLAAASASTTRPPPAASGAGTTATATASLPTGVKGWSWGAFFLNWIWALGNGTWIGLLALVPPLLIPIAIILGFKGREWAWKKKSWQSVEHFNSVQRLWSIWGFVFATLSLVGGIGYKVLEANEASQLEQRAANENRSGSGGNGASPTAEARNPLNALRDAELRRQQEAVLRECFGAFTNTCTSKNIDFDIAVLKANDTEGWIPFIEIRTKAQMIEVFGSGGWDLFEKAVNNVRDKVIERLRSDRPGLLTRWFRGDEQPIDGGIRAFTGPEDVEPIKDEMKLEFVRLLKASGWRPSPEFVARFGKGSLQAPSKTADASPPAGLDDRQANPEVNAAPGDTPGAASTSTGKAVPFVGTQEFNFAGGSGTGESITITADGTTKIMACGDAALGGKCSVEYSGPFRNSMQGSDGFGWLIQGDQVIQLRNGQPVMECGDDGHQKCVSSLTPVEGH